MSSSWGPRAAAARAVAGVVFQHRSLSATLPQATQSLEPSDRALAQEISYGVLRNFFQLEAIGGKLLKRPFKKKDGDLYALILGGIYQLNFMRTPPHAILSETVNATRHLRKEWARGLVNAVLRRFQREHNELIKNTEQNLTAKTNHPDWIIKHLQHAWPDQWEQILVNNNQRPPMTLRVNLQKVSREQYMEQLAESRIEAAISVHSPATITLNKGVSVSILPGFESGDVSVQDEAPQQAAILLEPQPNERILDACAAPGGKTAHILETAPEIEEIVALDIEADRLKRIEENMERLGITATITQGDASNQEWWDGKLFDRILVDAPCSATGVIRRNPDIKLLRRKEDIPALAATQYDILESCWGMLKQGGTLLYATCSIFPEENEEQVQKFLGAHPEASPHNIEADWGQSTGAGWQLLSGDNGVDGFYYARLLKQELPDT
ncbi:MAG: 16S rRNA (cytosine(967)-C(5))-methyltransferase RsmB [Gammaproteobacteria bacterium]|uniref:16S rRNA (cytosine(967)-C(5))-methyltransferase n=1 Tax=Candidatus Thiopontia autotrophica TaxID=2841688 RepID=A0A8J6P4Y2_9GAMM|nr:16S rRNA (cytosine(967)-C(5))-methyltransferase RsmB [Candidatus Thiopontia autotrophica]MBL6968791.1 16S rRNA (cytosine(967)-C(5))-methyltransferase RsmB [Gammaproteobacteria bacterium]